MRLIDADYVLNIIKEVTDPNVATDVLDHIIATTPTAYDVDKVIEEFESKQIFCDKFEDVSIFEAIDIVKRGGVE